MKGIDHRMSRGVRELRREKEIQIERSPCGPAACFYFKFVLILSVLVRGRNIHGLSLFAAPDFKVSLQFSVAVGGD